MPERLSVAFDQRNTTALAYHANDDRRAGATLVLAHGAGAGQTSRFIVELAEGLAGRGVDVLTFNFLYTEQGRKVPDRTELLEACYRATVAEARSYPPFDGNRLFIGGKSMGGRIASHLAAAGDATAVTIAGLVLLGYPLHPPGKPEHLRVEHLSRIRVPVLVVQGEHDPFGSPEELRPHFETLSAAATVHVVTGGDHSLAQKTQRKRGALAGDSYGVIQDAIVTWLAR